MISLRSGSAVCDLTSYETNSFRTFVKGIIRIHTNLNICFGPFHSDPHCEFWNPVAP